MKISIIEQTRWIWGVIILGILLLGSFLVSTFPSPYLENSEKIHPGNSFTDIENSYAIHHIKQLSQKEMDLYLDLLRKNFSPRNPFIDPAEKEWKTFLSDFKERPPCLEGIIAVENTKVALLQGCPYHEGDVVEGFKIVKIEKNSVALSRNGKVHFLYLSKKTTKKY